MPIYEDRGDDQEDDRIQRIGEEVTQKHPHQCPVCGGNGFVANGFYNQVGGEWSTSDATPEKCRSCDGSGIVWG